MADLRLARHSFSEDGCRPNSSGAEARTKLRLPNIHSIRTSCVPDTWNLTPETCLAMSKRELTCRYACIKILVQYHGVSALKLPPEPCTRIRYSIKAAKRQDAWTTLWWKPDIEKKDDDATTATAIVAVRSSHFAGLAAAALVCVRSAWRKICGDYPATASPGNARIVATRTDSVTNKNRLQLLKKQLN